MIYSNLFIKKPRQIPTFLAIAVLAFSLYLIGRFFLTSSLIPSRATKKLLLRLEISNILPNQVTLFWQTQDKENGWVLYGKEKQDFSQIAFDERDLQNKKGEFFYHYVTIKNLDPETRYFFNLASTRGLMAKEGRIPFSFQTMPLRKHVANQKPAYGKVVRKNGSALEGAIILLSFPETYQLSALSKSTGEWLIALNNATNAKTGKLQTLSEKERMKIEIISETKEVSIIQTYIRYVSPLEEITVIGKNYDFTKQEEVLSASTTVGSQTTEGASIEILYPKENSLIPQANPLIKGTALPNSEVTLTLREEKSSSITKTKTDKDGIWKLLLKKPLVPGAYTIYLNTKDQAGSEITKERKFTIAKSGERVLGEATGAATPSISPTAQTTVTPLPTTQLLPSQPPPPPVSGGNISYLLLPSLSLVILGIGFLLFF